MNPEKVFELLDLCKKERNWYPVHVCARIKVGKRKIWVLVREIFTECNRSLLFYSSKSSKIYYPEKVFGIVMKDFKKFGKVNK